MKQKIVWMSLILSLVIIVCGFSVVQGGGEPLKFGAVIPLTGNIADTGDEGKRSMLTAVDIINNDMGGVNGHPIEIVFEDEQNQKTQATAVFRKLAADKEMLAIMTCSTACSMACSPLAERYMITLMSPFSIGAWPGGFNDWTFRNTIPDIASVPALMKAAKEKFGINRCAMMYDYTDDWAVQAIPIFQDACKSAGIEIPLEPQSYARGDTDYSPQLTKIKVANPDGIFAAAMVREGSLIVSQSRKLGIKARFLGTSGIISADGLCQAGPAAEGTASVHTFHRDSTRPEFVKFYKRLREKYPDKDLECYVSVTCYDAIMLLADAVKRAGIRPPITTEKRKALRDALASTSGFEGATGTFHYKGSGDALPRAGVLVTFDSKTCTFKVVD